MEEEILLFNDVPIKLEEQEVAWKIREFREAR